MAAREWFENEDFWLNYGPVMFDSQHWAEAGGIAERCCAIANLPPGSRVLDACCGPGRISVELALLGMDVTGVDIMQPFLNAARESAEAEGQKLTLLKQDMRNFVSAEPFAATVNVYNSFGYCESIGDDTKILQSIYGALRKGGTFILECISREIAVQYYTEGEWFERNGITVLTSFAVVGAWEGLRSTWTLIDKDGRRRTHEFVQRLYSAAELRDRLRGIGFSSAEVYGGFDLSPYDHGAKTMVIVARK